MDDMGSWTSEFPVVYFTTAATAWKMVCSLKVAAKGEKIMSSWSESACVGWIQPGDQSWLADPAVPNELQARILEGFRLAVCRPSATAPPKAWLAATIQAGGVGFLDPPGAIGTLQFEQAAALLRFVTSAIGPQVNLLQLMLPRDAVAADSGASAVGFRFGANLLLLGRICSQAEIEPLPAEIEFRTCGAELSGILAQTYEATQDCPLLTGKRPLEEVLKGYEATGSSGKKHWRTLFVGGIAVGCVLVALHSQLEIAELVYMGLIASARGKGLGAALLMEAEKMTLEAGLHQLVIGVDAANAPARRVYEGSGYGEWDQKRVLLWFPEAASGSPSKGADTSGPSGVLKIQDTDK